MPPTKKKSAASKAQAKRHYDKDKKLSYDQHTQDKTAQRKRMEQIRTDEMYRRLENDKRQERISKMRKKEEYIRVERKANAEHKQIKRQDEKYVRKENAANALHMQALRQNEEYAQKENAANALHKQVRRQNEEYARKENAANALHMQALRQNEEYAQKENAANALHKQVRRQNEEYARKENAANALHMQALRQNEEYAQKENAANALHKQVRRQNEEYARKENAANALHMQALRQNEEYARKENAANALHMQALRQNEEYAQKENAANALHKQVRRQNEEYARKENAANALHMQALRQNEEYAQKENAANALHKQVRRQNEEYAQKENAANALHMQALRQNEEYAQKENAANALHKQVRRQNEEYSRKENVANVSRMRRKRTNEEYAQQEAEEEARRKRVKRSDEDFRRNENKINAEQMKRKRATDAEYHANEQEANIKRMRTTRANPECSREERAANRRRMKELRKDESFAAAERSRNARSKREVRTNLLLRQREVVYNSYLRSKETPHSRVMLKFLEQRKELPNKVCSCCENLFMPKGVVKVNRAKIVSFMKGKKRTFDESVIDEKILNYVQHQNLLCHTCMKNVRLGKIPKMSSANGLKLPEVDERIKRLNNVEKRFVSPVVAFVKLVPLSFRTTDPQLGMKGNAIHIPVDVNEMITELPRKPNELDMISVPVEFKRCKEHKSNYLEGLVRPWLINDAADYLSDTILYQKYKIGFNYMAEQEESLDDSDEEEEEEEEEAEEEELTPEASIDQPKQIDLDSDDEFYDQLNDGDDEVLLLDLNEIVAKNATLVMAPGQGKTPVSAHQNRDYEFLAFVDRFGGNPQVLTDKNISRSDRIKHEVRFRIAPTVERLLYCAKDKLLSSCANSIQIACRKKVANNARITAAQALASHGLKDFDEGLRILEGIPVSPSYMQKKKKILFATMAQLGPPTFFVTLSISERECVELIQGLVEHTTGRKISQDDALNMPSQERAKLINSNPVFTAVYLDNLFNKLLNVLKDPDGIFQGFTVSYHVRRREFQARGTPHDHILIKLHGAPTYDPEDPESAARVVEFVDKFITCEYDPDNINTKFLRHKHTHTCCKGKRNKEICRFNFPQFVMPETMILQPLPTQEKTPQVKENLQKIKALMEVFFKSKDRINKDFIDILDELNLTREEYITAIRCSIKNTKIFYKRRSCDVDINAYNREILNVLSSNVDMQFIVDPYAVAAYILEYVLKQDAGLAKAMKDIHTQMANGNYALREKFRQYASKFLNCHLMTQFEAVYYALGIPMTKFKLASIFINTGPKDERVVFLKSFKQLEGLDPESTEIFGKDIHEHYAARVGMDNICEAEFAAYYFRTENKPRKDKNLDSDEEQENDEDDDAEEINEVGLRRRVNPRIIRFVRYNKDQDPDNYYREQLLLFLPWRDEDRDIGPGNWEAIYNDNIVTIERNRSMLFHLPHSVLQDAFDAAEENRRLQDEEEVDEFEADPVPKVHEIDLFVEVGIERPKPNMPFNYCAPPLIDKVALNDMLRQLNAGQKEIVMHIYKSFTTDKFKDNYEPLRIFVSGSAGVGKSMVIRTVYQLSTYHFTYVDPIEVRTEGAILVLLCALSGKASHLIGGNTLHSAFALPLQECAHMPDLPEAAADNLRKQLSQCKLLIIDEASMVGGKTFSQIDTRCRQIFGRGESFGGLSVILFGDLNQLPPVKDTLIFEPPKNTMLEGVVDGSPLWDEFYLYELTEVMRQKDDLRFVRALNNLALGKMTNDEVKLLKAREMQEDEIPDKAIRLSYTNKAVDKFNNERIAASKETLIESNAVDSIMHIRGRGALTEKQEADKRRFWQNKQTKECGGYPFYLPLKKGIKYMITANIDVADGLVNGATGELHHIHCDENSERPTIVFIDFGDKVGKQLRIRTRKLMESLKLSIKLTPIERRTYQLTTQYHVKDYSATRDQFPLVPCEALTIHKSQGQTYPEVCFVIDPKDKLTRQLVYVAISRVTKLDGLYILGNFKGNMKSNDSINKSLNEMQRMRTDRQLPLAFETMKDVNGLAVAYLNVQSLRNKVVDIVADAWYARCGVLIFAETWTQPDKAISIPNFELKYRSDAKFDSKSVSTYQGKGLMCFAKSSLQVEIVRYKQCFDSKHHLDLVHLVMDEVSIICGYRSPKFKFDRFLCELAEFVGDTTALTIVMGDFNVNLNVKTNQNTKTDMDKFISLMSSLNMESQLQSDEITHNGGSQLDVVFSNFRTLNAGVYECYFSDHKPVYAIVPDVCIINSILPQECRLTGCDFCRDKTLNSDDEASNSDDGANKAQNKADGAKRKIIYPISVWIDNLDKDDNLAVLNDTADKDQDSNVGPSVVHKTNKNDKKDNDHQSKDGEPVVQKENGHQSKDNVPVVHKTNNSDPETANELLIELLACLNNDQAIQTKLASESNNITQIHDRLIKLSNRRSNRVKQCRLSLEDFYSIGISGDGNCQYNAISRFLTGNESHQSELRILVFDCIWRERNYFRYLFNQQGGALMESRTFDELLRLCCTDAEFGNQDTLIALSMVLRRRIYIYSQSYTRDPVTKERKTHTMLIEYKPRIISNNNPIVLLLTNPGSGCGHYTLLRPKKETSPFILTNTNIVFDIGENYATFERDGH